MAESIFGIFLNASRNARPVRVSSAQVARLTTLEKDSLDLCRANHCIFNISASYDNFRIAISACGQCI
jgi:hypothetical protein